MFISVMYVEHTWPPTFPIARTQPKTAASLGITIAFISLEYAVCKMVTQTIRKPCEFKIEPTWMYRRT